MVKIRKRKLVTRIGQRMKVVLAPALMPLALKNLKIPPIEKILLTARLRMKMRMLSWRLKSINPSQNLAVQHR